MGKTVELKAKDGFTLGAYRADPAGKPKGGLVVIQEIFGANRHIRAVADRFAGHGYAALAPALFDRVKKGVELSYDPASIEAGRELHAKTKLDEGLIAAAVKEFHPKEALQTDAMKDVPGIQRDAVKLKFIDAPLSQQQLTELFQIPPR